MPTALSQLPTASPMVKNSGNGAKFPALCQGQLATGHG
jgi:hypothetical protein